MASFVDTAGPGKTWTLACARTSGTELSDSDTARLDASAASSLSAGAGPRAGSTAASPSATPAENIATESYGTQTEHLVYLRRQSRFRTEHRLTQLQGLLRVGISYSVEAGRTQGLKPGRRG